LSYTQKIILAIFFTVIAAVWFFLSGILNVDKTSKPLRFGDIETVVPGNFTFSGYQENGWQGQFGANRSRNHWLTILRTSIPPGKNITDFLPPEKRMKYLKVSQNLYFGFVYKGKSYRRYFYLIKIDNQLYWLESGSRISTLLQVKEIVDRAMAAFRLKKQNPIPDSASIFRKTTAFVTPIYSQSLNMLIAFIAAILVLVYVIILIALRFSGREPRQLEGNPAAVFKGATIKINYLPLGSKLIDGIVALVSRKIFIYSFGKEICHFDQQAIRHQNQIKLGKTFFFRQDFIRFRFSEPIAVQVPGRRREQKTKTITFYLKDDQIRQLLMETGFPCPEPLF
jgi:hypothetical protein